MAVTTIELAIALRVLVDVNDPINSAQEMELERINTFATQVVEDRAPSAPDVYKNEAIIKLAGYIYDQPTSPGGTLWANAFRNCGAGTILASFIERRALVVGEE